MSHHQQQKGLDVSRYDNTPPTQLQGVEDIRSNGYFFYYFLSLICLL